MSEFYQIIPVKENIYRIYSLEAVYCDLLVGTEQALLIDTGYGFGDLRTTIKSITDKPLIIVNTHGHVDHTSGNCQFEEKIYISEEDMELCRRHNAPAMRKKSAKHAEHVTNPITRETSYGLPENFVLERYESGGTGNIVPLKEGTIFDLGGMTIKVIKTPGHTKGGMSFLYQEENWLYVGDATGCFLWLFDDDATDRETYISMLDKVIELAPSRLIGGHTPAQMTVEDVKRFKKVAKEADFSKGLAFESSILEIEQEIRVCPYPGQTMADIGKPEFAAIVVSATK